MGLQGVGIILPREGAAPRHLLAGDHHLGVVGDLMTDLDFPHQARNQDHHIPLLPDARQGVAQLGHGQERVVARILRMHQPLPAAAVAGDEQHIALGRIGGLGPRREGFKCGRLAGIGRARGQRLHRR